MPSPSTAPGRSERQSGASASAQRAALSGFARLPIALRRLLVRAGTPRFTAGAVVLLYRGSTEHTVGELLLVRQRHTGRWALPGGLVRRREAPQDTACRELAEETGITVQVGELRPATPAATVDVDTHRVDVVFLAVCPDDAEVVVDGTETLDYRWISGPRGLPDCTEATADVLRVCNAIPL